MSVYLPILTFSRISRLLTLLVVAGGGVLLLSQTAGAQAPTTCELAWRIVRGPDVGGLPYRLNSVAALSPYNIWAVGSVDTPAGTRTLTAQWDGEYWIPVPSPNVGNEANELTKVVALAYNDLWAMGFYGYDDTHLLLLHWNGVSGEWTIVHTPLTLRRVKSSK